MGHRKHEGLSLPDRSCSCQTRPCPFLCPPCTNPCPNSSTYLCHPCTHNYSGTLLHHPGTNSAPAAPSYHAPAPTYHAAPAYHAPVKSAYHAEPTYYPDEILPYTYSYAVADDYSKAVFSAGESSDGASNVQGSYSVNLPDGRVQHVTYHSNGYEGFVAEVTFEGEAHYPTATKYHTPAPKYHA